MSNQVTPLSPLKRGHFAYGSNGLTVNGIAPVSPNRLRELLFTDLIIGKWLQKQTRDEAYKIITKPWITAQLRYYDIRFGGSGKRCRSQGASDELGANRRCKATCFPHDTFLESGAYMI